jgi:mannose-1-phosphate guanylyltransferase
VRVGEGAQIGHRVRIAGPSVVGDGVRIGDDAVLERAIVWNGAVIGAGAAVRDSIVGERYVVADGETLDDAIVANEPEPEAAKT